MLVSIDPSSGNRSVLVTKYQGESFNSPNDVTIRSDGTIYFTDPDFRLGGRTAQLGFKGGGSAITATAVASKTTNIAFGGADLKALYVAAGKAIYFIAGNVPGYPN